MSRYRVWEANRKIFLFPENWLEPEFRDGKTHLFRELEGALLQGDVSSDLVEDAFLNYLQKLDELARLDLVAMHVEDNPDPALRTLHVFGRTHGSPHNYFYRRYEHETWTPWEPVTPKIDGDHVAPVIWRDRLYLFWVTFEFRAAAPTITVNPTANQDIDLPEVEREVDLRLHWAACLKGEWTTPEFSNVVTATKRKPMKGSGGKGKGKGKGKKKWVYVPITVKSDFDPASVFIHVTKEPYEDGEERGVYVHLGDGNIEQSFYMAGRNSTPIRASYSDPPANPYSATTVAATRYTGSGVLAVTYDQKISTEAGAAPAETSITSSILQKGNAYSLLPCDNAVTLGGPDPASLDADNPAAVAAAIAAGLPEIATLIRPFFYQDPVTTLFVQPDVEERTMEQWDEWVTPAQRSPSAPWSHPEWWDELAIVPNVPWKRIPVPVGPDDYFPNFKGIYEMPANPGQDWITNPATGVVFNGEVVSGAGRVDAAAVRPMGGAGVLEGRVTANIGRVTNVIGVAGLSTPASIGGIQR
jgi:hypothetical protein